MVEPEKPFACAEPDCGMTFTNEDHLNVHSKKHDMVLQLGNEQRAFVADQTPTPTRFIRNCEEVGLFQDLNVNPFDEGFKRAMETKPIHALCLEAATSSSDDLHTPQMAFPLIDADSTLYSSTNNHRNITISRSSSDESGAVKEYETTTISKLTNEVTTISRIIEKQDGLEKTSNNNDISLTSNILQHKEFVVNKDIVNEKQSVSFKNNVIKIHNDVTIRKDGAISCVDGRQPLITQISFTDSVIKDATVEKIKDENITQTNKIINEKLLPPPIMSQKSLDFVVENLTAEICGTDKNLQSERKRNKTPVRRKCIKNKVKIKTEPKNIEDYEVTIKLPNGKRIKMKAETEDEQKPEVEKFINTVGPMSHNIVNTQSQPKIIPILPKVASTGTLIPVRLVAAIPKLPMPPLSSERDKIKETIRKHTVVKKPSVKGSSVDNKVNNGCKNAVKKDVDPEQIRKWESHSAASKRYRERLKQKMDRQTEENRQLKEKNEKLMAEKALLKMVLTQHLKECPLQNDLRALYQKLS